MLYPGDGPPPIKGQTVGQVIVCRDSGYIWDGVVWLLSHGSISREGYPALYAVVRDQFGECDDPTEFNLPDLRSVVTKLAETDSLYDGIGPPPEPGSVNGQIKVCSDGNYAWSRKGWMKVPE
jgi:tail collar domain